MCSKRALEKSYNADDLSKKSPQEKVLYKEVYTPSQNVGSKNDIELQPNPAYGTSHQVIMDTNPAYASCK